MMTLVEDNLTEEEFDALVDLKTEHKPFFEAMLFTMGVIVPRNHKYTGSKADRNVFENFILDAKLQGIPVEESFKQWVSKKVTRILLNDGDYADESFVDSLRDLANYAMLWIAWLESQKTKSVPILPHDFARPSEPGMINVTGKFKE